MLQSFACRETERYFREGKCPARWQAFEPALRRKLIMLNAAIAVEELRVPPGNRLERLKGRRQDQWSIRINQQWRLCFVWGERGPEEVEVVDYH